MPQRWNRDPRYRADGFWKCRERDNAARRTVYLADIGPYIRRRKRDLAAQRTQILEQLTQLEQEAKSLAQP